MSSELTLIKLSKSQSADYIIDALRGVINDAHKNKILHLDISYKIYGDPKVRGFVIGESLSIKD